MVDFCVPPENMDEIIHQYNEVDKKRHQMTDSQIDAVLKIIGNIEEETKQPVAWVRLSKYLLMNPEDELVKATGQSHFLLMRGPVYWSNKCYATKDCVYFSLTKFNDEFFTNQELFDKFHGG